MRLLVFVASIGMVHLALSILYEAFPLMYYDEIVETSRRYGIDPVMVLSVVKVESGFDEDAVSPAGAIGLMQLMRSTASWLSKDLDPKDPLQNIELGVMYLAHLLKMYDGNVKMALMAYNVGPGHLRDGKFESSALRYYTKVMTTYRIYWMLYFLKFSQS